MTELDAIRQRHSVRAYTERKIEPEKQMLLQALLEEVNAEGNLHLQFVPEAGRTFNRLMNKAMGLNSAPSVIACVGPDDETLEERIGYYGQKVVLAAQEMGLNTCWAGFFNKKNLPAQVGPGERAVIVIAIGYGVNGGKVRKSKTAAQVSAAENPPAWFALGVELALLAPTAMNQQKFFITLESDGSVQFADKGGPFSKVDLGIVKYHFAVGERTKNGAADRAGSL